VDARSGLVYEALSHLGQMYAEPGDRYSHLTLLPEICPSCTIREMSPKMATNPLDIAAAARLEEFFEARIGRHLKDRRKRESFAIYAAGILGDGERKSVEPIAAKACGEPESVNNLHSK